MDRLQQRKSSLVIILAGSVSGKLHLV